MQHLLPPHRPQVSLRTPPRQRERTHQHRRLKERALLVPPEKVVLAQAGDVSALALADAAGVVKAVQGLAVPREQEALAVKTSRALSLRPSAWRATDTFYNSQITPWRICSASMSC